MSEVVGVLLAFVLLAGSDFAARLILSRAERRAARTNHFIGPCGRWTAAPASVSHRR